MHVDQAELERTLSRAGESAASYRSPLAGWCFRLNVARGHSRLKRLTGLHVDRVGGEHDDLPSLQHLSILFICICSFYLIDLGQSIYDGLDALISGVFDALISGVP